MAEHISEVITLLGVVFFLLIGVLGWIGNKVHNRLDNLTSTVDKKFDQLHGVLDAIKDDLHGRITDTERRMNSQVVDIDRRVGKLETRCDLIHAQD